MSELDGFVRQIKRFEEKSVEKFDQRLRRTALAIHREVVLATPVGNPGTWKISDTARAEAREEGYQGGTARGNWRLSIGSRRVEFIEHADPTGARTLGEGAAVIGRFGLGQVLYMQNATPYIAKLNDGGHSRQAWAPGFVERAFLSGLKAAASGGSTP